MTSDCLYLDTTQPVTARVKDLVSRMTLEEKISQMLYGAPAIERLGVVKHVWWNEGLHGVARAGVATVFPQAIGLAATWNPDLMHQVATAISDEGRAKHHEAARRGIREIYTGLTYWSPNINIFRDPRWGRGQETYGEDPYLTGSMGVSFVKGLQGNDPRYTKLVATPKHFAVHSGPEKDRHTFNAVVNDADLRHTYLAAFEACVKEADAASVMGAYNRTNGEPCCASPTLLQKILREEWGFDGYVVSDCEAIRDIFENHKVVNSPEAAAALAVNNGCELNCGSFYKTLGRAIEQGLITEEVIDRAVERLFTARFKLGMFDPAGQVPYTQIPFSVVNSPAHQQLTRRTARESIVLLKNEGNLLPLPKNPASIAVIGPMADNYMVLLGNYCGTPDQAVTILDGIRSKVAPETVVYYAQGCDLADGIPVMRAIPTACLRPENGYAGQTGLTARYFDNPDFAGEPALTRIDPLVDFIWKTTSPVSGNWGDHFSVRWTGYIIPPASGTYKLGANGFTRYKVYLDGKLIAEQDNAHHPICVAGNVTLEAGRLYPVCLEFADVGIDPQIELVWSVPDAAEAANALEVAQKAEVVVMALGLSPLLEGEEMPIEVEGFAGGDRTSLNIPRPQEELLKQIHALGKPVVLVLTNGSALSVNWAAQNVPAIVEAWYSGEAGGAAIADILFGDYNPAGRLPVTFYQSVDDLPPFDNYDMPGHTYRYFTGQPLYPFGHGLSYTQFKLENLTLDQTEVTANGQVTLSVDVVNTGERAGEEVVQLYARREESAYPQPLKELKGFARLHLAPAERKTVSFTLFANQFGRHNGPTCLLEPGAVQLMVGRSSADLPLSATLNLTGPVTDITANKKFFSLVN